MIVKKFPLISTKMVIVKKIPPISTKTVIVNKFPLLSTLEAQWAEHVSLTFHSALRKFNTEPSIGASHQISFHFGKAVSDKKIFRN